MTIPFHRDGVSLLVDRATAGTTQSGSREI